MFFRSQKGFDDTLEDIAPNRLFDSKLHFRSILHVNPLGRPPQKSKMGFMPNERTFTRDDSYAKGRETQKQEASAPAREQSYNVKTCVSIDTFDHRTISRFDVFGRAIRCPLFMIHKLFTNLMFKLYDEGAAARPGVAPR